MAIFETEELRELTARASMSAENCMNISWRRAYEDLAYAADVLAAFHKRSTVESLEVPTSFAGLVQNGN